MTVDVLAAAGSAAYAVGQLTAMIGIPLLGLVLLIVGLNKRSKSKTPPPQQYPYQQYPPQQYPYQQNPAWPPPPGYPPRKPAGTGLIVAGSILLVFGVLGFLAQVGRVATNVAESRSETPEQMKIGDCLTAAGMATRRMVQKPADCADPKAVFELAATGDGAANCPDGKRDSSDYSVLTNDTTTLCFTLNLVEGRCYAESSEGSKIIDDVPCSTPDAARVLKRVDGSTEESQCDAETIAIALPEPARLFCMGAP